MDKQSKSWKDWEAHYPNTVGGRMCPDPVPVPIETSAEIGARNRRLMFGDNGEAFPDKVEWARIVD